MRLMCEEETAEFALSLPRDTERKVSCEPRRGFHQEAEITWDFDVGLPTPDWED